MHRHNISKRDGPYHLNQHVDVVACELPVRLFLHTISCRLIKQILELMQATPSFKETMHWKRTHPHILAGLNS